MFGVSNSSGGSRGCCKDMYIEHNSFPRRILDFFHLLNLIFIAFSAPVEIAFDLGMKDLLFFLEAISLSISFFVIVLNFRTPVIVKGQATLQFSKVANYYWQNGMLIDMCGILPFNLVLGKYMDLNGQPWYFMMLIVLLRIIRIISCWQAVMIFSQFEVYLKKHNFLMGILKASMMLFFLGHLITCSWFFVNNILERDVELTWAIANNLQDKSIIGKYLLCYYTVLNVVTSVGYGDMYPVTDMERMFFILMINTGDVLFALAFGLLAQITMEKKVQNENEAFIEKMLRI